MIKHIFVILLILSLVLISGCTQNQTETAEEQAVSELEQEMEEAIEDISMEDIENSLVE